jgi:hypothetical protein
MSLWRGGMEASCGRSGGPAQPLDEQDLSRADSDGCPPHRLDLDEKQDGRRRGHHRGQLEDSGGLAGDGNHEEYHRGRDSRQNGEERKSMIGSGVGARRVAFGSFAADILHVDLEGLEVRGGGRVRGTRLEEGAQGKAAERTRAREEGPAAAGEGFETREEGFEACGKSYEARGEGFEARGEGFEARGKGFEARGKGFEARGKGFDGARGEGLTQLSDKMPATPDSGYSTGLSTPG